MLLVALYSVAIQKSDYYGYGRITVSSLGAGGSDHRWRFRHQDQPT